MLNLQRQRFGSQTLESLDHSMPAYDDELWESAVSRALKSMTLVVAQAGDVFQESVVWHA